MSAQDLSNRDETDGGAEPRDRRAQLKTLMQQRRHREALALARRALDEDPADERLADVVTELEAATHWSMLPMWPLTRFGWIGAVAVFGALIVGMQVSRAAGGTGLSAALAGVVLVYLAYTWVWPSVLRKLLSRR